MKTMFTDVGMYATIHLRGNIGCLPHPLQYYYHESYHCILKFLLLFIFQESISIWWLLFYLHVIAILIHLICFYCIIFLYLWSWYEVPFSCYLLSISIFFDHKLVGQDELATEVLPTHLSHLSKVATWTISSKPLSFQDPLCLMSWPQCLRPTKRKPKQWVLKLSISLNNCFQWKKNHHWAVHFIPFFNEIFYFLK